MEEENIQTLWNNIKSVLSVAAEKVKRKGKKNGSPITPGKN